jgi:hypothetical protein
MSVETDAVAALAARAPAYVEWYGGERKQDLTTPPALFAAWNAEYGFTLDGAATPENALLPRFSSEAEPLRWSGERVFCNPPWSSIPPFVELAALADLAVLLTPARTNARWFHRALALGAVPSFFLPKPKFGGLKWNTPVDCLLLVFGR